MTCDADKKWIDSISGQQVGGHERAAGFIMVRSSIKVPKKKATTENMNKGSAGGFFNMRESKYLFLWVHLISVSWADRWDLL